MLLKWKYQVVILRMELQLIQRWYPHHSDHRLQHSDFGFLALFRSVRNGYC